LRYFKKSPMRGDRLMPTVHSHKLLLSGLLLILFSLSASWLTAGEEPGAAANVAAEKTSPEKASSEKAASATDSAATPKESPSASSAKPPRELSPELTALRNLVRQTLANYRKPLLNTRENSTTEIMAQALAFGCASEVMLGGANGQPINGITCLCWNYPCAGLEMLGFSEDHIAARVGYGYQERPGELLAILALSRVSSDYPVRVGETKRTIADLVSAAKRACRPNSDLSLALIGLSYYVEEPSWKNDLGEEWSVERMIREELSQPVVTAPEGGLNRLLGLSYAVARRAKQGHPIDGQFERAGKYAGEFQEFALQLQNSDGSWGPHFLAARAVSPDVATQLRSTGRILEWLALSLPAPKLEDERMARAVQCLAGTLNSRRYQASLRALPTREIISVGHALHALNVYDERLFQPLDAAEVKPEAEPAAEKPLSNAARGDSKASTSR
jgi:hypothetical protein